MNLSQDASVQWDGQTSERNQQQSILSALECPVCYSYCLPPIMQCRFGHVVCNQCLPNCLPACPVCRTQGPGAFIRSLALDTVAEQLQFPCRFQSFGCPREDLSSTDKPNHEVNCPYQET